MAISVLIGTYNSAKYLRKVIENVKDFDEVLIFDHGSTDNSIEIAREAGCAVLQFDKGQDNAYQTHNTAIKNAKNDWILFLRPNELAPKALKQYLDDFILHPEATHGLFIPRRNFILEREDTNDYPDFQLRFFHRGGTLWNDDKSDLPSVYGRIDRVPANRKELAIVRIPGSINDSIGHLEKDFPLLDASEKVDLWHILSITMGTFMKEYILKGKFRYGTTGYIDSVNITMKEYFKLAKRHEKRVMEEIYEKLK